MAQVPDDLTGNPQLPHRCVPLVRTRRSCHDGAVTSQPIAPLADDSRCPCGTGDTYGVCCARFHREEAYAPTAERLMRSRYSAFVVGHEPYLLRTWHPTTRPHALDLDPGTRWLGLDVLDTHGGGLLDASGTVRFRAHYVLDGVRGDQTELSRFARDAGAWSYVDGQVG